MGQHSPQDSSLLINDFTTLNKKNLNKICFFFYFEQKRVLVGVSHIASTSPKLLVYLVKQLLKKKLKQFFEKLSFLVIYYFFFRKVSISRVLLMLRGSFFHRKANPI